VWLFEQPVRTGVPTKRAATAKVIRRNFCSIHTVEREQPLFVPQNRSLYPG
jgi:hypothetical protein